MAVSKEQIEAILSKELPTKEDFAVLENYEPNDGRNMLFSFFTPIWLCQVMYDLAKKHGFKESGKILEPACGTGNFITILDRPENCTAFELNELNMKIAQKRAPKATYYNNFFETALLQQPKFRTKLKKQVTWLEDYPFDLVIGNPPYGKYSGFMASHFKSLKIKQVEQFFMYQSMRLLKPGGLLVFITGSGFMRSGNHYLRERQLIAEYAEFVDAYRMPKVFKNTQVGTDILIFRRK